MIFYSDNEFGIVKQRSVRTNYWSLNTYLCAKNQ
jgi:hypothetical protein